MNIFVRISLHNMGNHDDIPSLTVEKEKKLHSQYKYAICEVLFIKKYVVIFTSFWSDLKFFSYSSEMLSDSQS